jgi:hypothetical protein
MEARGLGKRIVITDVAHLSFELGRLLLSLSPTLLHGLPNSFPLFGSHMPFTAIGLTGCRQTTTALAATKGLDGESETIPFGFQLCND